LDASLASPTLPVRADKESMLELVDNISRKMSLVCMQINSESDKYDIGKMETFSLALKAAAGSKF
jgi:hypothetical protein